AYLMRQMQLLKGPIPADDAASLLLWGEDGAAVDCARGDFDYTLPGGRAEVIRRAPWFLVLSAFTAQVIQRRWIQDRQNFVSVFRDGTGLIAGGGNTKLQPSWSNFTVGDESLLERRPGDEDPVFIPPLGLHHVPEAARLLDDGRPGVELVYSDRDGGKHRGRIRLQIVNRDRLRYTLEGDSAMAAHFTILPRMGQPVKTAVGQTADLGATPFHWQPGAWIEHAGVRFPLPPGTTARWPVLPHDPYTKDGHAEPEEGRLVIDLPAAGEHTIEIEIRAREAGAAQSNSVRSTYRTGYSR
ncbi:MAG: hypothetical protein ABI165_07515, partial [Bryobacteraceae bacterium]